MTKEAEDLANFILMCTDHSCRFLRDGHFEISISGNTPTPRQIKLVISPKGETYIYYDELNEKNAGCEPQEPVTPELLAEWLSWVAPAVAEAGKNV